MIKIYTILHSARTNVKGNAIIYLRINGLDKEVNISTSINIPKTDWDSKKEMIKTKNEQSYHYNKHIADLKNKIYSFIEHKSKNNELISAELLKNYLNGKEVKQSNKKEQEYTRDDIKNWIGFGINNGYVNKFKKEEINKWAELMLKHGVIKMNPNIILANNK